MDSVGKFPNNSEFSIRRRRPRTALNHGRAPIHKSAFGIRLEDFLSRVARCWSPVRCEAVYKEEQLQLP